MAIDRAGNIAARLMSAATLDQQLFEITAADSLPPRTERDTWQRPVKVADALGVRAGSVVADVGAGGGYFTFRLAALVGAKGKVYAQDLDEKELARIRERSDKEKLTQIQTIQGSQEDPKLPEQSADAVLIVDTFHEFTRPDLMVAGIFRALKPGGRLGVLDRTAPLGLKST
ncbi:MAG TPA: methyltransferase domain-containing protein, partial [Bryobacteraceae bacterium]|nr:methyltransferase domain-containing protein [Bryobacteraceae bacterium]